MYMDNEAIALKTLELLISIRFSRRLETGIAILKGAKGGDRLSIYILIHK